MCQLVESLKLKDGRIQLPEYHQKRFDRSRAELFPDARKISLEQAIQIPETCSSGVFKVRVLYRETIEKIEIEPYHFRSINSLKIVQHPQIDYHLKYSNRKLLQELFAQRETCDDLIIVKNGFVTDAFAANLLFFDGANWFTPDTPLLAGTKRQYLIDRGLITERAIRVGDISGYQKIGLVNALVDFDEMPVIPLERVVF